MLLRVLRQFAGAICRNEVHPNFALEFGVSPDAITSTRSRHREISIQRQRVGKRSNHGNLVYSTRASPNRGMSASAVLPSVRKSSYARFALGTSPARVSALASCRRAMMLAMWTTTGAPVAHLMGHWPAFRVLAFLIGLVPLAALFIHDRLSQGRIHPVSLWGGVVSFAWANLFFILIAPTSAWHAFADWIVGSR